MENETQQQQPLQDLGPLLLSLAAGAAAGAIAVVARKALGGDGGDGERRQSDSGKGDDRGTSFDDVGKVAEDLDRLVDELRSEAENGDFNRLVQIADTISEYADQAASAFDATARGGDGEDKGSERRVTDELMGRIREITGGAKEKAGSLARA